MFDYSDTVQAIYAKMPVVNGLDCDHFAKLETLYHKAFEGKIDGSKTR